MDIREKENELHDLLSARNRGTRDIEYIQEEIKDFEKHIEQLQEKIQQRQTHLQKYEGLDGKIDALILEIASVKK